MNRSELFVCNGCLSSISTDRFKCLECTDFDLCEKCMFGFSDKPCVSSHNHLTHTLIRIKSNSPGSSPEDFDQMYSVLDELAMYEAMHIFKLDTDSMARQGIKNNTTIATELTSLPDAANICAESIRSTLNSMFEKVAGERRDFREDCCPELEDTDFVDDSEADDEDNVSLTGSSAVSSSGAGAMPISISSLWDSLLSISTQNDVTGGLELYLFSQWSELAPRMQGYNLSLLLRTKRLSEKFQRHPEIRNRLQRTPLVVAQSNKHVVANRRKMLQEAIKAQSRSKTARYTDEIIDAAVAQYFVAATPKPRSARKPRSEKRSNFFYETASSSSCSSEQEEEGGCGSHSEPVNSATPPRLPIRFTLRIDELAEALRQLLADEILKDDHLLSEPEQRDKLHEDHHSQSSCPACDGIQSVHFLTRPVNDTTEMISAVVSAAALRTVVPPVPSQYRHSSIDICAAVHSAGTHSSNRVGTESRTKQCDSTVVFCPQAQSQSASPILFPPTMSLLQRLLTVYAHNEEAVWPPTTCQNRPPKRSAAALDSFADTPPDTSWQMEPFSGPSRKRARSTDLERLLCAVGDTMGDTIGLVSGDCTHMVTELLEATQHLRFNGLCDIVGEMAYNSVHAESSEQDGRVVVSNAPSQFWMTLPGRQKVTIQVSPNMLRRFFAYVAAFAPSNKPRSTRAQLTDCQRTSTGGAISCWTDVTVRELSSERCVLDEERFFASTVESPAPDSQWLFAPIQVSQRPPVTAPTCRPIARIATKHFNLALRYQLSSLASREAGWAEELGDSSLLDDFQFFDTLFAHRISPPSPVLPVASILKKRSRNMLSAASSVSKRVRFADWETFFSAERDGDGGEEEGDLYTDCRGDRCVSSALSHPMETAPDGVLAAHTAQLTCADELDDECGEEEESDYLFCDDFDDFSLTLTLEKSPTSARVLPPQSNSSSSPAATQSVHSVSDDSSVDSGRSDGSSSDSDLSWTLFSATEQAWVAPATTTATATAKSDVHLLKTSRVSIIVD